MDKPKTQREILAEKKAKEASKKRKVVVENVSKQMVRIRLQAPVNPDTGKRMDFYRAEGGAEIRPGKTATVVEDRLDPNQIKNLRKKGFIRVKRIDG